MDKNSPDEMNINYRQRIDRIIDEKLHGEIRDRNVAAASIKKKAESSFEENETDEIDDDIQINSIPQNSAAQTPISLESFDKAYDRHMRQVHEQLERSRRTAQSVKGGNAARERASAPPPPSKFPNIDYVPVPHESFLADEASEMARNTVVSTEWKQNTQRVVVTGSLGVHSPMENSAKDRMERDREIRNTDDDTKTLLPRIDLSAVFSRFNIKKTPPVEKAPVEKTIPNVNPDKLSAWLLRSYRSVSFRFNLLAGVLVLLLYFTVGGSIGLPFPGFMNFYTNSFGSTLTGMILLLLCALIGSDVISTGVKKLLKLKPDTDTVIFFSFVSVFLAGLLMLIIESWRAYPLPFILPVIWIFFRMLASKLRLRTKYRSARIVRRLDNADTLLLTGDDGYDGYPTYIRTEASDLNKFFYGMRETELGDNITDIYLMAASVFVLLISVISALLPPEGASSGHFFYAFACIMSMVPSISLVLSNSLTFSLISKRMYKAGAVTGGSRNLLSYSHEAFTSLLDSDLYPPSAISITDFKLLSSFNRNSIFQYTASLLTAVGCSLAGPFNRVIKEEFLILNRVTNIRFTGEAISADIDGHHIIIGDDNAMRRSGFNITRIQAKTPLYVAIDGEVVVVFAIAYNTDPDTEYSLRLLIKNLRIPVIAARDFNITVERVEKNYRVRSGVIVCPPIETRIALANPDRKSEAKGVVFIKEGIRPVAETIEGARRFRFAASFTLIAGAVASLIGLFLVTIMICNGWFYTSAPEKLLLFQLLWFIPSIIIALWSGKY